MDKLEIVDLPERKAKAVSNSAGVFRTTYDYWTYAFCDKGCGHE